MKNVNAFKSVVEELYNRFSSIYGFLYDNGDGRNFGYDEAMDYGDELVKRHAKIVDLFAERRMDILTSDREVAAFGYAVKSMDWSTCQFLLCGSEG